MIKLYCGGSFCFDYLSPDYKSSTAADYRAQLLGNVDLFLQRSEGIPLGNGVVYIGPFYFETADMESLDVVKCETDMIRRCTDAFFLLDDAACPGTISELTLAAMLGKRLTIFYIQRPDNEETECHLHSPCWYPMLQSTLLNSRVALIPCKDRQEAADKIRAHAASLAETV